jgi:hypothetical protein
MIIPSNKGWLIMNIELLYTGLLDVAMYVMTLAGCVLLTMLFITFFAPVGDEPDDAVATVDTYRKPGWW